MAVYNGMNSRGRRYPYNRNAVRYRHTPIRSTIETPVDSTHSDIPPEVSPPTDSFPNISSHSDTPSMVNGHTAVQNLLNTLNLDGLSLDRDKLILLGLMYLLYKEDKAKENFKLLLALGYILI